MNTANSTAAAESKTDTLGGIVMLGAAALALVWANSPWAASYGEVLAAAFGPASVGLNKSLGLWISDGLMAIFFLYVGLEIKREVVEGRLSSRDRIALPAIAALGGMIVPALVFLAFNYRDPMAARGWAVPCATDIAFSLAVLRVVGNRVPASLRLFLTAVAILDDIGAIAVIAFFYTDTISLLMLAAALIPIAGLVALNRARVASLIPYLLVGLVLWVCVLKSGIHPTLAGVAVAAAIPMQTARGRMLDGLEHSLKPWVVFLILPVFALANAGVSLQGMGFAGVLEPVALGIILGLVFGKTLGVALGILAAKVLRISQPPEGASWLQLLGVAYLCGIGFTMSLLVAVLAYETQAPHLFDEAKLGVLVGSLLGAIAGIVVLLLAPRSGVPPNDFVAKA
ncbi:MAG: Na+/H+ antiporter NhaA [Gammaproteobacteria bacterium]